MSARDANSRGSRMGYRAVSTFSGCGGSSLGLTQAGFDVIWANEFVPIAADTYDANSRISVNRIDIRQVSGDLIRDEAGLVGDLDLFEGSPPCSAFSTSGIREKGWGSQRAYSGTIQRVDDLFGEYVRLVSELRPRAFIAENVMGLSRGVAKGYLIEIVRGLQAAGYRVEVWHVNAARLGVPQTRNRLIIVGVRADMTGFPERPLPLPEVSLRKALGSLDGLYGWEPRTSAGDDMPSEFAQPLIGRFAVGRCSARLAPGTADVRRFNLCRSAWNRPAPCVTATAGNIGAAGLVHPDGDRKFSVMEMKRICGFPDDFRLEGTYQKRVERLGRAVPPPVYRHIGRRIIEWLDAQ